MTFSTKSSRNKVIASIEHLDTNNVYTYTELVSIEDIQELNSIEKNFLDIFKNGMLNKKLISSTQKLINRSTNIFKRI